MVLLLFNCQHLEMRGKQVPSPVGRGDAGTAPPHSASAPREGSRGPRPLQGPAGWVRNQTGALFKALFANVDHQELLLGEGGIGGETQLA